MDETMKTAIRRLKAETEQNRVQFREGFELPPG